MIVATLQILLTLAKELCMGLLDSLVQGTYNPDGTRNFSGLLLTLLAAELAIIMFYVLLRIVIAKINLVLTVLGLVQRCIEFPLKMLTAMLFLTMALILADNESMTMVRTQVSRLAQYLV